MDKSPYDFDTLPMFDDDDDADGENETLEEYEFELMPVNCPYFENCEEEYRRMPPKGTPPFPPTPPGQGHKVPGMPPGRPPKYIPEKYTQEGPPGRPRPKMIDEGAISFCRYKYTYIWQRNGRSYWAYITFVGRRSISGFRWMHNRWVYFGIDLRQIDSFYC